MSCGTCKYWRVDPDDPDGDKKCYAYVILSGETHPHEVDPWDQIGNCTDWTQRNI